MMDKRLLALVPEALRHVLATVAWQWAGLVGNVALVWAIARVASSLVTGVAVPQVAWLLLAAGVVLRVVATSALRDAEAFVEQDTHLFHDSIRDNLLIARPEATDAELEAACRAASVHDFICSLPNGYDTMVGELGDTLSGGECQRLGLTRAFLHDAPLLLLDEPTSNLDPLNEAQILKSLSDQRGHRAVVLISHRPSTMAIADKACSMDQGRVS